MIKVILKYFLILILIIVYLAVFNKIFDSITSYQASSYKYNIALNYAVSFIYYLGIGMILGLSNLINEFKKSGKWRINFFKLIIIGLPALFFSFSILIYYGFILNYPIIISLLNFVIKFIKNIDKISGIFFGFIFVTSFYKFNSSKLIDDTNVVVK